MPSRAVIRIKDLQHMIAVLDIPEIPGTNIKAMDHPSEYNENHIGLQKELISNENQESINQSLEIILLSLVVVRSSLYSLLIKPDESFKYEFRNIYFAQEEIVVIDKEYGVENVRFTLFPYITMAIGAASGIGIAGSYFKKEVQKKSEDKIIVVTEHSPDLDQVYETTCESGEEPEAIERMSDFLISAHATCLKGVVDNE